jgi:uncharacterized membrane protein
MFIDQLGAMHGFLKDGPTLSTIDVPGANDTAAFSINNEGDIAGGSGGQGFILHKGQFVTVPLPDSGAITGINDRGELGGIYLDSVGVWHGFVAKPIGNSHPKP